MTTQRLRSLLTNPLSPVLPMVDGQLSDGEKAQLIGSLWWPEGFPVPEPTRPELLPFTAGRLGYQTERLGYRSHPNRGRH